MAERYVIIVQQLDSNQWLLSSDPEGLPSEEAEQRLAECVASYGKTSVRYLLMIDYTVDVQVKPIPKL